MTGTRMPLVLAISLFALSVLPACGGGAQLIKDPIPVEITQPLSQASDQRVAASLNWVIVRDGAGAWARNADWDEYQISVANRSDAEIRIISASVIDSQGIRLASNSKRKRLVAASKTTTKRYKESNLAVQAGFGGGALIAAGAGSAYVGSIFAASALSTDLSTLFTGTVSTGGGGAASAASAFTWLAPVLIVGGIARVANNNQVAREIKSRHTSFPIDVRPGNIEQMNIFFPIAPSPLRLEIIYVVGGKAATLVVNTDAALNGLHLVPKENQALPGNEAAIDMDSEVRDSH